MFKAMNHVNFENVLYLVDFMKSLMQRGKGHTQYRIFLITLILLVIMPIFVFYSIINYNETELRTISSFESLRQHNENEITNSIQLVDAGLKIFEKSLEDEMKDGFDIFLVAYNSSGEDPSLMNLTAIKEVIGDQYDLYIINASGVIIATTYEEDLGLDFRIFPEFYEDITLLREGNSFAADRITTETRTGLLRKYSYMPTPDHQYLLELGLVSDEFKDCLDDLNYLDIAQQQEELNPYLISVRIFDRHTFLIGDPGFQPTNETKTIILDVYTNKESYDFTNATDGTLVKYFLVDLYDDKYPGDDSRVVELAFDMRLITNSLNNILISHIFFSSIIACVICFSTILLVNYLVKPIDKIIKGVNLIADGNLDHKIDIKTRTELKSLAESINEMSAAQKQSQESLKKNEKVLREVKRKEELYHTMSGHFVRNDLQKIIVIQEILLASIKFEKEIEKMIEETIQICFRSSKTIETVNQIFSVLKTPKQVKKHSLLQLIETSVSPLELPVMIESETIDIEILTNKSFFSDMILNFLRFFPKTDTNKIKFFGVRSESKYSLVIQDIESKPIPTQDGNVLSTDINDNWEPLGYYICITYASAIINYYGGTMEINPLEPKGNRFHIHFHPDLIM